MPEVCLEMPEKLWFCDHCHAAPGSDFFDGFWFCAACRRAYIERISQEATQ